MIVPEAIEGLKIIGMGKTSALLEKAALLLGSPYPRERDDRWDALLVGSGRSPEELERIFKKAEHLYLAFGEATSSLPFDSLSDEILNSANEDNGGFQDAATQYARLAQ